MKLLRLLAMATCLFTLLCASQQPVHVHADACEDACNYNLNACTEDADMHYDWCYSDAENEYSYCEGDAWTNYYTCLNGAGGFPALEYVCEVAYYNAQDRCWESFVDDSRRTGAVRAPTTASMCP